jgi:protein ImuB
VRTRTAIEIGLNVLLERLCKRLYGEGLGIRSAMLTWYRVDGKNGNISIGTNHPSNRTQHLFKLFFNTCPVNITVRNVRLNQTAI